MARSHLTLAALATSAAPGLEVVRARSYSTSGQGDYDSALLVGRDGRELIIRVPRSQSAETEQSSDLLAINALTAGVRSRLPFVVPSYVGQTPVAGTRAVLYDYIPGTHLGDERGTPGDALTSSIGYAIAAIHSLPTGFVADAGMPSLTAAECHGTTDELIESAASTGLLPNVLRDRWRSASADPAVWQFQPTVINGALTADSFLVDEAQVIGVLGWSALRVGDPARDLHWLLALAPAAAESALGAYASTRQIAADRQFTQRALLYAELEVARWLMHGREVHDQSIVDDAVSMLNGLVERIRADEAEPLEGATEEVLAVDDVEALLDRTPGDRSADDYGHGGGMRPVADDQAARNSPSE